MAACIYVQSHRSLKIEKNLIIYVHEKGINARGAAFNFKAEKLNLNWKLDQH